MPTLWSLVGLERVRPLLLLLWWAGSEHLAPSPALLWRVGLGYVTPSLASFRLTGLEHGTPLSAPLMRIRLGHRGSLCLRCLGYRVILRYAASKGETFVRVFR